MATAIVASRSRSPRSQHKHCQQIPAGTRSEMRAILAAALITAAAASKKEKKPSGHGADVAAFVRGAHKADDANVAKAKRAVHDGLAELLAYYNGDEQVLDALVFATAGLAPTLEAKLAKLATSGGGKFVVAAFGSSVTAGHDGFGHTAWPAVLGRRLAKELAPLGIEVEVRNQAVGGAEPFPRSLCVGPIAGSDVDLVIREWEYWGFSDGLEAPGAHGGERDVGHVRPGLLGQHPVRVDRHEHRADARVRRLLLEAPAEAEHERRRVERPARDWTGEQSLREPALPPEGAASRAARDARFDRSAQSASSSNVAS